MAEPFLSEIRIMSFNFAPKGWATCDGQLLPINQNQALFSLLGTNYGGDGRTTFGLPDLRNRVPIHMGSGFTLGERGGEQAHTLSIAELAAHAHAVQGNNTLAAQADPTNAFFAQAGAALGSIYNTASASLVAMNAGAVANAGGSQAHDNMMPYLTLTFCIALQGIFPSQT
jgi:microcystin-dependent protein